MTAFIACTGFVTGYKRAHIWVQVYDKLIFKKPGVIIGSNMQAALQVCQNRV